MEQQQYSLGTVGSTGIVRGVADGAVTISYTNGCGTATKLMSVSVTPTVAAITGASTVCAGATTILSNTTPGGYWTGSARAAVGSSTGEVTGLSGGSTTIYYTVNGCIAVSAAKAFTVNPLPATGTITGTATVCPGGTTTLADAVSGGVWSSGNLSVAAISTTGVVSGVDAGTATISYGVTGSCGTAYATRIVTVTTAVAAGTITGTATVCAGATRTLANSVTGGVWSSDNAAIAIVGTTGIVSGVAAGTATISYAVTASCGTGYATKIMTVSAAADAGAITGTATVCTGATTALTKCSKRWRMEQQ